MLTYEKMKARVHASLPFRNKVINTLGTIFISLKVYCDNNMFTVLNLTEVMRAALVNKANSFTLPSRDDRKRTTEMQLR